MLELWLLAAIASAAPSMPGAAPPAELLEFIGDWSPQEQKLIEQAARPKTAAQPTGNDNAAQSHDRSETNPPR
jgi:hypothetical protein